MAKVADTLYDNPRSKPSGKVAQNLPEGDERGFVEGKYPKVDHEAEVTQEQDKASDLAPVAKQLRSLKGKVEPGNLLRLYQKNGRDLYFRRDDTYPHGFGPWPKFDPDVPMS